MSHSVTRDEYLFSAACAAPPQDIILDPEYKNIRLVTPIGRILFPTVVQAKAMEEGKEKRYSCGLALNPEFCGQIWEAVCKVADNRWPGEQRPNPQNPSEMVTMTGSQMLQFLTKEQGGLQNPIRQGDQEYMKNPAKNEHLRGLWVLNAAVAEKNRKSGQSQQPIVLDESGHPMDPSKLYGGCYGRLQVTIYAFPMPGQSIPNRGIAMLLNAVQFARHGEKLGSFDALKAAKNAFGALPKAEGTAPGAAGAVPQPNGNPWMTGGGAAPAGAFAAPGGAAPTFPAAS